MGLSVTTTYGIIFTASLLMLGTLLNSMIYAYNGFNDGLNNRVSIIENSKNVIKVSRVVYNQTKIEIYAVNKGPKTEDMAKITLLVNGNPVPLNYSGFWYPGEEKVIDVQHNYSQGNYHGVQFNINAKDIIASAEYDKIYVLNKTEILAYNYDGTLSWFASVKEPRDICVGNYVYILNSTGVSVYSYSGQKIRFFTTGNLSHIATRGSLLYMINRTKMIITNDTGSVINTVSLSDGKDVSLSSYVYVLDGSKINIYNFDGDYISSIDDSRLNGATNISANTSDENILTVLTNYGEILLYQNNSYYGEIPLPVKANNIDLFGKIYLCGSGLYAMDIGFHIKIVDQFGNSVYCYL